MDERKKPEQPASPESLPRQLYDTVSLLNQKNHFAQEIAIGENVPPVLIFKGIIQTFESGNVRCRQLQGAHPSFGAITLIGTLAEDISRSIELSSQQLQHLKDPSSAPGMLYLPERHDIEPVTDRLMALHWLDALLRSLGENPQRQLLDAIAALQNR